jgi:hypothetical protein
MKIDQVREGMEVMITKIDQTDAAFTSGSSMHDMIGNTYIVDSVNRGNIEVRLGGWSWHPGDLEPLDYEVCDEVSEAMIQEITLFNPKEIVV